MVAAIRSVRKSRSKYQQINDSMGPEKTTKRIKSWRNSVDSLHKELTSHANQLRALQYSQQSTSFTGSKSLSILVEFCEKASNEIQDLIKMLKSVAFISNSCEFPDWELVEQSLKHQVKKAIKAEINNEKETIEIFQEMHQLKENLFCQIIKGLLHKKVVLWMDLGILETGYTKGEVLEVMEYIKNYNKKHGHLPSKVEYQHPSSLPGFQSSTNKLTGFLKAFYDEFHAMVRLIENNFGLATKQKKKSPMAESLREELEKAYLGNEKLEREVQNLRYMVRSPDKKESIQLQKEVEELRNKAQQNRRKFQKVTMEKLSFENENAQLKQKISDLESRLKEINEYYLPRLQEMQELNEDLSQEVKNIRQDAELLPSMFRNEAFKKKKILDQKIELEQKYNDTLKLLQEERGKFNSLLNDKSRKEKMALQAVAARNSLKKDLEQANQEIQRLSDIIANSESIEEKAKQTVQQYKEKYQEMQEHIYVQNNRISELEQQKKVLIQQLKGKGISSEAHYTFNLIKGEKPNSE